MNVVVEELLIGLFPGGLLSSLQVPEARTPLKSLEEIKLMFQRFSFSPFSALSTLSPPQGRASPRSFTNRLFTRGKTASFAISTPPSSPTEESDPGQNSNVDSSDQRSRLVLPIRVQETNAGGGEDRDREDSSYSTNKNPDVEDVSREAEPESESDTDDELLYEAESPDEAALVHAARAYRCTLRGRSADGLLVDLPGIGSLAVQLLHILPFDSNRKRMSVVVRHPLTGQVVVYTKGADSVIMDLAQTPEGIQLRNIDVSKKVCSDD